MIYIIEKMQRANAEIEDTTDSTGRVRTEGYSKCHFGSHCRTDGETELGKPVASCQHGSEKSLVAVKKSLAGELHGKGIRALGGSLSGEQKAVKVNVKPVRQSSLPQTVSQTSGWEALSG